MLDGSECIGNVVTGGALSLWRGGIRKSGAGQAFLVRNKVHQFVEKGYSTSINPMRVYGRVEAADSGNSVMAAELVSLGAIEGDRNDISGAK